MYQNIPFDTLNQQPTNHIFAESMKMSAVYISQTINGLININHNQS